MATRKEVRQRVFRELVTVFDDAELEALALQLREFLELRFSLKEQSLGEPMEVDH